MNFAALEQQYDADNLKSMLYRVPSQFTKAYQYIDASAPDLSTMKVSKVLLCGMGGSSLPADVVNNLLYDELEISVSRDYRIPRWVAADNLVIISSYSGNTEETLSALEAARNQEASIVIITAGGKLLEKAHEYGFPVYQITEQGIQPRMATPYFIVYLLDILFRVGCTGDKRTQIESLTSWLESLNFESTSQAIASQIGGKVPVIYSTSNLWALARIWKICINENAKTQAFWYYFPELNHNEMCGYTNLRMDPVFLFLRSSLDHPRNQKRMSIFKEVLENQVCIDIPLEGETLLQQAMYALLLSYWTSYYLALSTQVNPTPVAMVEDFKERMGR